MSVIDMHASWLAINSIVGCPNDCKYCVLHGIDKHSSNPSIIASPKEAVEELLNYKYYDKKIPICILPTTDAFVNSKNAKYLVELLDEIDKKNITNDLVIPTKCRVTNEFVTKAKELQIKGQHIVVFISYSGLDKNMEPRISEQVLRDNFKILKENNIDIIHYYRPFLPQNSDQKKIKEILDFVNQYTNVSSITGLALQESFIDKIDCWDEIASHREECLKANSVWPESAWNFFNEDYSHQQQTFQTTTCALNTKLSRPSLQYYGSYECNNYNHCSEEQRMRCMAAYRELNQEETIEKCKYLLTHLGFDAEYIDYSFDSFGGLILTNVNLRVKDVSYLSQMLGLKVYLTSNNIVSDTYNSTLNGAKPLILKARK